MINDANFDLVKQNLEKPEDQRGVPLISPSGEFGYYPKNVTANLLGQGYQGGSDYETALKEGKYGGFGGSAAAATAGASSFVSLGLSDVILSKLIGAENLKNLYEVNPGAELTGEAAGALVPILGELGGAVKAGTAATEAASKVFAKEAGKGAEALSEDSAAQIAAQSSLNGIDAAASGGALTKEQINAGMTAAKAYAQQAHEAIDAAKIDPGLKDYLKSAIDKTPAGYITNISNKLGQQFGEGVLNPITSNAFLGSAFAAQTTLHDYAIGDPVTATSFISNALAGAAFGGVLGGVTHVAGKVLSGLFTREKIGNAIEKDAIDKSNEINIEIRSEQERTNSSKINQSEEYGESGHYNEDYIENSKKTTSYQERQDAIQNIMQKSSEDPEYARFAIKAAEDNSFVESLWKDAYKTTKDLDDAIALHNQLKNPTEVHPIAAPLEDAYKAVETHSKEFEEASKKLNYGTNFDLTANPELAKTLERGEEWQWKAKELNKIEDTMPIKGQASVLHDDMKNMIDHINGRVDENFQPITDKELRALTAAQYSSSAVAKAIKAGYKQYLIRIRSATTPAEFYSALNRYRANLGKFMEKKVTLGMQPHEVYSISLLSKAYDTVSSAMKDQSVWGQFGKSISDLYEAKSAMIKAKKAFDKAFKVQGEISSSKIGMFLRGAGKNPIHLQKMDILNNYAQKLKNLQEAYVSNGIDVNFGSDELLRKVNSAVDRTKKITQLTRASWYQSLEKAGKVSLEKPKDVISGIGKAAGQRILGAPTEILMPHKWALGAIEFAKNISHNVDFDTRINANKAWEKVDKENFSQVLKAKIIMGKNIEKEQKKLNTTILNSFPTIKKSSISNLSTRSAVSNYNEEYKKLSDLVKNHLESNVDIAYNKIKDVLPPDLLQQSVLQASKTLQFLQSALPPEIRGSKPLPSEKKDFVDTFNAVMYPTETLQKILNGTASFKETQVFIEKNPYIVQKVTAQLQKDADLKEVDYNVASKLSLFNIDTNSIYANNGLLTMQNNAKSRQQQQQTPDQMYPYSPQNMGFKFNNYALPGAQGRMK